jgi:hypothetical protein
MGSMGKLSKLPLEKKKIQTTMYEYLLESQSELPADELPEEPTLLLLTKL